MKTIRIKTIHAAHKQGSSRPLVVEDVTGDRYLVKLRGAGDGVAGLIAEVVATRFLEALGVPVRRVLEAVLAEAHVGQAQDDEQADTLAMSVGSNLATPYFESGVVYAPAHRALVEDSIAERLFLFDVLTLNVDRTLRNPNLIVVDEAVYPIDHGSCLRLRLSSDPAAIASEMPDAMLQPLREHPFCMESPDVATFHARLDRIASNDIDGWLEDVPPSWWFGDEACKNMRSRIQHVVRDREWLRVAVKRVAERSPETADMLRARAEASAQAFERKTGLTVRRSRE